jgi:hypothetical protein
MSYYCIKSFYYILNEIHPNNEIILPRICHLENNILQD